LLASGGLGIVYDGDGNLVSETVGGTTTKFLVDTFNPTGFPQVLDEIVNGSVIRTYAYGLVPLHARFLLTVYMWLKYHPYRLPIGDVLEL